MVRKDDNPVVTWRNLGGAAVLAVTLGAVVINTSNAAKEEVKEHDESPTAHTQNISAHDSDKFSHEQMRKMMNEEMKPMFEAQTIAIKAEIKKLGDAL